MKPLCHRIGAAGGGAGGSRCVLRLTPPSPRSGHPRRLSRVRLHGDHSLLSGSWALLSGSLSGGSVSGGGCNNGEKREKKKKQQKHRRSALVRKGMMSHKRCGKKDGDEEMRMDAGTAGGDQLSSLLFVVLCRVYEPLSPPPWRLSGLSRSPMRLPLVLLRFARFCDAFSAPAKIGSPPAFSPLLPLFHHPHVSVDSDRVHDRGGGGEQNVCGGGAGFRKQRQRRRSPGRRTLLPVMLLIGAVS